MKDLHFYITSKKARYPFYIIFFALQFPICFGSKHESIHLCLFSRYLYLYPQIILFFWTKRILNVSVFISHRFSLTVGWGAPDGLRRQLLHRNTTGIFMCFLFETFFIQAGMNETIFTWFCRQKQNCLPVFWFYKWVSWAKQICIIYIFKAKKCLQKHYRVCVAFKTITTAGRHIFINYY